MTKATGRLLHHDPASRAYAAPRRTLKRASWRHDMGPVLDQADINGCTGWSGADWMNSAKGIEGRKRWNFHHGKSRLIEMRRYVGDDAGLELYKLATRNDPFDFTYPPTDGGSSGLGVAKALKSLGVIDAYLWTFDFEQMLAHGQAQPVLLGTLWTDAMSDPDSKGLIRIGSARQIKAAEDSGMGHEYTLRGVNWPRKLARIRNHWTSAWGDDGEADIPLDDLETLIIAKQGDVMVPEVSAVAA
ncbi:peptidase [Mycobacterium phage CRB2]|uniref:Uncharacterized protein n=1 Tax=Mycobacterium phage CRB2 TaxID=2483623 RepID=A0A455LSP7_9CAUD|nr:peptidase [Mycobacterium phage CRB2]AYP70060.1 hypothetical protein CRB2_74 [Mycobacterium phage CRB2]